MEIPHQMKGFRARGERVKDVYRITDAMNTGAICMRARVIPSMITLISDFR